MKPFRSVVMALLGAGMLSGCVSLRTTIEYRSADGHNTATAVLKMPPRRVYEAALYVLRRDPTAVIHQRDDKRLTIDAFKILQHILITITPVNASASRVDIVSDAGPTMSRYTDQALGMMQELCNRLNIVYTVPARE